MRAIERVLLGLTAFVICLTVAKCSSDAQNNIERLDTWYSALRAREPPVITHVSRSLRTAGSKLKTCIITADFWGMLKFDSGRGVRATLKGGGGTATASHLLANVLREQDFTDVTFLGVTKEIDVCTQAQKV